MIDLVKQYWQQYLWGTLAHPTGLIITLWLLVASLGLGFILAVPLAVAKASRNRWFSIPVLLYAYVIRGTPLYVQLLLIYSGLYSLDVVRSTPFLSAFFRDAFNCTILAFTLNTAAYTTEIFAGAIKATSPAGVYLSEHQIRQQDFNSYGSRRGNHEVMERGTFANIRIRNEMMGGAEGGNTIYYKDPNGQGETMSIFDAAQHYKQDGHGTVVIGGKEYGTGSSRDWAAKGPALQGVRAVITESFERIHRSNLIGMGVAPFCFEAGKTRKDYGFTGREVVDIPGLSGDLKPRQQMEATVRRPDGSTFKLPLHLMIMTADEVAYFKNGGILPYVLRNLLAA